MLLLAKPIVNIQVKHLDSTIVEVRHLLYSPILFTKSDNYRILEA
jgi:hypothetical protein